MADTFAKPDWEVTLWPNRSSSLRGLSGFVLLTAMFFAFFAMLTIYAPAYQGDSALQFQVFAVIVAAMSIVLLGMLWAFRRNYRDGEYREHLSLSGGVFVIKTVHPRRAPRLWKFPGYWTRVKTRSTAHVENQLILLHADKAVAIGEFLTPEERMSLAEEIEQALNRFTR